MGRPNTSNSADLSHGREKKSDLGLLEDTIETSLGGSTPSSTTNKEEPSHGHGGKDKAGDATDLRKVVGRFPLSVWLVLLLTMAERFSFYGMTAPFMNYMQNGRGNPLRPGVLAWGQAKASQVSSVFFIMTLLTPIGASLVADKRLGRYMVLCITFIIYLMGSILLLVSSLLSSTNHAAALFILSLVFIAVGMSGVNGLLAAFVGDQYTTQDGNVTTTRRGERVLIDRGRTIESIYNMYYWSINVGGLAGLATTELELHVGFWAAYLLPTCALSLSAAVLYLGRTRFVAVPAQSSALPDAMLVLWLGARAGFSLDAAKPHHQRMKHSRTTTWDDDFVEQVKMALAACRMMLAAWPMLWLCRGQMSTNLISQAAQMQTSGVPNDMMYNANPLVIIIFLPIVDRVIVPWLRRSGFALTAVTRLVYGFALEALAIAMAAILQKLIYNAGPCYEFPLRCAASEGGAIPNEISVFVQLPIYALEAFSEILASPAGYELAFIMAPITMKSVVQAVFSTTGAMGATLSVAISPTYKDPNMTWVYTSISVAMALVTISFYWIWGRNMKGT